MKWIARAALAAALLIALAAGFAGAEELPLAFDPVLRIWGLDLGVGWTGLELLEARGTTLWLYLGGGWERMPLYRMSDGTLASEYLDLATGGIHAVPPVGTDAPFFQRAEAKWQVGIVQGLVADPVTGADLVSVFSFLRGCYDSHLDQGALLAASSLPDRDSLLQNSLILGLSFDGVAHNAHTVKSGAAAEASVEWGPGFAIKAGSGALDFVRFNTTARLFVPLLDILPDRDGNLFALYLGDFVSADWVIGGAVPLNIRQSFGGRNPRLGLGGAVRGVDAGSLDANFKAVNNLELRIVGPALLLPSIVPGLLGYLDAGAFGQVGEPVPDRWGFVAATGAGVFVDFFGFAQLTAYVQLRLSGANADGGYLTPFAIDFTLKF